MTFLKLVAVNFFGLAVLPTIAAEPLPERLAIQGLAVRKLMHGLAHSSQPMHGDNVIGQANYLLQHGAFEC